ncbi:DUF2169 domain-containing protein [Archangium violaceum]|uniref:DUF2169 family type VI secretion system accessory protein n=1 Tax=Archangium violaceum TaxID=83451 RepID=UPI00193C7850|nr:DUF2169 domain-containing protein [Archangium violaceum]QRK12648.1 DUF2169 domain-containing protein [Archangium violaceum]
MSIETTDVDNITPFTAETLHSVTREDREVLLVVVAGTFTLPRPCGASRAPVLRDEQLPPKLEDSYWGAPACSSLRYEGQNAYFRPGTDIYLNGHARAQRGHPVKAMDVSLAVGHCHKTVRVFGERLWMSGMVGLSPSSPLPFESMPLVYERAFGGTARDEEGGETFEARNPVGRGFYVSRKQAREQLLPNIEDPQALVTSWSDRPPPAGFGPVSRGWQPRLGYAGTYDAAWVENRAPLWPKDLDPRFFQAATPGLNTGSYLQGGERVLLEGMHHDGPLAFALPQYRLLVRSIFSDRQEQRVMRLDALLLEPDAGTFTMMWRAAIPLNGNPFDHPYTQVRLMESWEELPK